MKADLMRQAKALIWDECTMSDKRNVEAVDCTLRDLRRSNQLLGGIGPRWITNYYAEEFESTEFMQRNQVAGCCASPEHYHS